MYSYGRKYKVICRDHVEPRFKGARKTSDCSDMTFKKALK